MVISSIATGTHYFNAGTLSFHGTCFFVVSSGVLNQTLVTPPNPTPRAPGSMQSRATASPAAAGPPPTPPPRALPGLLRRRYSVPETIMRK